jgi:hypothetical protein
MTIDTNNETTSTITRAIVPEDHRADFVDALFGIAYPLQLEPAVFTFASKLSSTYRGAYWSMYALSNRGWYMYPDDDDLVAVRCDNGYEGTMTADAFGVVCVLYAFSHLSFGDNAMANTYARHYHLLRDFAAEHGEAAAIFAAID